LVQRGQLVADQRQSADGSFQHAEVAYKLLLRG